MVSPLLTFWTAGLLSAVARSCLDVSSNSLRARCHGQPEYGACGLHKYRWKAHTWLCPGLCSGGMF